MRHLLSIIIVSTGLIVVVSAQPQGGAPAPAQKGGGRGRGGGRGPAQTMILTTTAWPDGGMIPLRYTQAGPEISPAIQWSPAPAGTASFVLIFHDADTVVPNSTDDLMHWMLWNIPGTATSVAQGRPDGFELPDGTRQISASGSRYRGPGASSTGSVHHYVLELYALDTVLDIKVPPQGPQDPNPNPQAIRTSIMQAMVGHIRGKAAYIGLFRRPE
jgi:Raf kinase inhibitor-like YbhB/YbcL family protein